MGSWPTLLLCPMMRLSVPRGALFLGGGGSVSDGRRVAEGMYPEQKKEG